MADNQMFFFDVENPVWFISSGSSQESYPLYTTDTGGLKSGQTSEALSFYPKQVDVYSPSCVRYVPSNRWKSIPNVLSSSAFSSRSDAVIMDVITLVFHRHMDPKTLTQVMLVNKIWRGIAKSSPVWLRALANRYSVSVKLSSNPFPSPHDIFRRVIAISKGPISSKGLLTSPLPEWVTSASKAEKFEIVVDGPNYGLQEDLMKLLGSGPAPMVALKTTIDFPSSVSPKLAGPQVVDVITYLAPHVKKESADRDLTCAQRNGLFQRAHFVLLCYANNDFRTLQQYLGEMWALKYSEEKKRFNQSGKRPFWSKSDLSPNFLVVNLLTDEALTSPSTLPSPADISEKLGGFAYAEMMIGPSSAQSVIDLKVVLGQCAGAYLSSPSPPKKSKK